MERIAGRLESDAATRWPARRAATVPLTRAVAPPAVQDPEMAGMIQATMVDLLQALSVGMVIVDGACCVLFADNLARQILRRADAIMESHGRLRPTQQSCRQKLFDVVARLVARSSRDPELVGLSRRAGNSLLVLARKLSQSNESSSGMVLLLLSDPDLRADFASDGLGPLFELTASELRLLGALLRGQSLTDYAVAAGISRNTVRSQLKRVFQKTGFARQAELVGAMLGDPLVHLVVSRGSLPAQ